MNALIVEDEAAAARRLEKMINTVSKDVNVLQTIDSTKAAVSWLKKNPMPDLIFMDIHLADGDCFKIFREIDITAPVIFITAYDQYAMRVFEVNAVAYLLKPVKQNELEVAFKKFEKFSLSKSEMIDYQKIVDSLNVGGSFQKRLLVKIGQTIRAIEIKDIAYFFTQDKIVTLVLGDSRRYPIDFNLDELEQILDQKQFFRINRQFIINSSAIREMYVISKSRVKINLNPSIDAETAVSAERVSHFKRWLTEAKA